MKDNQWTLIPDYKQTYRAIMMFKDEFQLDFINVEELGMREEEVDERVIENNIVFHNLSYVKRLKQKSAVNHRRFLFIRHRV